MPTDRSGRTVGDTSAIGHSTEPARGYDYLDSPVTMPQTHMKTEAQALSKLLLLIGGVIFFFGDRALEEFWKLSFVPGLLVAIGGGIAFISAGGVIQSALTKAGRKDRDTQQP